MMINPILLALSWQHLSLVLVLIAYALLLTAYVIRGRELSACLATQAAELDKLKAANQLQSEKIELLSSGYQELPEQLIAGIHRGQVSDVLTLPRAPCWSALLKISAGDECLATDLAKMLITELPVMINELDQISTIADTERELFHQWQGLFRCCGIEKLAERFDSTQLSVSTPDNLLDPGLKEELIDELRQTLLEAFHAIRHRAPEVTTIVREFAG